MFNVKRRLALVGVGTLAAAALAFPSAAGADSNGSQVVQVPISIGTFDSCTDEYVNVTGDFGVVSHSFIDSAGGYHQHLVFSVSDGKGVGVDSGNQYVMTEVIMSADNEGQPPSAYSSVINSKLIGQGSVANQTIQIHVHETTDAQGKVSASIDSATITCQG